MKIGKSIITTTAGVLLAAFSGMALATAGPQKQSSPAVTKQVTQIPENKSTTSVSQGSITSINSNQLVLSHTKDGTAEKLTFMLSPKTERKGDLTPGAQVTVHYRTEDNHLMATAVQAMPLPTASNAKNPIVKK